MVNEIVAAPPSIGVAAVVLLPKVAVGFRLATWMRRVLVSLTPSSLVTALGEKDKAAAAMAQAADRKTPATALDHFLAAEQLRIESVRPAEGRESRKDWKFDRDKLADAIAGYRQALRADPDHYWSAYQLGRSLVSLGRTAEGVEALGACVALRPEDTRERPNWYADQ